MNEKNSDKKAMTRVGFEPTQHYVMRNPLKAGKPKLESHALTARPSCLDNLGYIGCNEMCSVSGLLFFLKMKKQMYELSRSIKIILSS